MDLSAESFAALWRKVESLERRFNDRPDDSPGLDGMTLAQLEAMAERLGAAAKTIRDAQALLGAPPRAEETPERPVASPDAIAAHRLRQLQPPEQPGPKSQLRASEQAAKRALMAQFAVDPDLPEDMQAMERGE